MQVHVRDNNVDQALRALKKKLQREGVFREMKLKQHFEKPSVRKAREKAEEEQRLAQEKEQQELLALEEEAAREQGDQQYVRQRRRK